MHRFLPELATRSVPRYTSYPTAAEFHGGVGADRQAASLGHVRAGEPVSLYVHIPYCQAICWYCGCSTGAIGREGRIDAYLDALSEEIALVAPRMAGRVVSVHFGGGSPNALSPAALTALAARLRDAFAIGPEAEWAIELDPRSLTEAQADAIGAAGFARASLGVQTFSLPIQSAINRIQPFRTVANGAAWLRAAGVRKLNFDLMYGLPRQTLDDIATSIAATLDLAPDRVAMFGYAHLPRMLPRQKMIDEATLPGAEARFWQSALAHDLLVEAGFAAIGFDHFARPDDPLAVAARSGGLRRNFQGFTDDPARTLIGLGASAISQFDDLMIQNEKHVGRYRMQVRNGRLAGVRGVAVTPDDRLRADAIERLLCDERVDLSAVRARHPGALSGVLIDPARIAPLVEAGVVTLAGEAIAITPWARPYARLAAAALDAYRATPTERFSRAV